VVGLNEEEADEDESAEEEEDSRDEFLLLIRHSIPSLACLRSTELITSGGKCQLQAK